MDRRNSFFERFNPLIAILAISPFLVYFLLWLLPTFDDWNYFTTPNYDFGEHFYNRLLPFSTYWRPWDCMFSYVLSLDNSLFPALNHIAVYAGHIGCTVLVYKLSNILGFKPAARNISTIFFFISTGMLGTVLGIDSLNQVYSHFWGLLGLLFYLNGDNKRNRALWIACAYIALFAKENGIGFFIIPQIIAYAFNRISFKKAVSDTTLATIAIFTYFIARFLLHNENVCINEEYIDLTVYRYVKSFGVFLGMTWLPIDYVSLVRAEDRNIYIVFLTLILSMPFMAYVFLKQWKHLKAKPFLLLALCMIIGAFPHLATAFSAMHPYSTLGIASLMLAYLLDKFDSYRYIDVLFTMLIVSCCFIDWHHWQKSYESGIIVRDMVNQGIKQENFPKQSLYLILIDQGETKYSSFCVIPYESFFKGTAIQHANKYEWPKEVEQTIIYPEDEVSISDIVSEAKKKYDSVWIVKGREVEVL